MDTSAASTIPMTAWQQAAIVVLFAVFFTGLVIYLLRWFTSQQKDWQEFIAKRDDDWRAWMDKASCDTTGAMKEVSETLRALAQDLKDHDRRVDQKFDEAVKLVSNGSGHRIPERRKTPRAT